MDIVLLGHGSFGKHILESIQMISGLDEDIYPIAFYPLDSEETVKIKILDTITSNEVLILTDIPFGTPFRVAATLAHETKDCTIRVLSGTNVAMALAAVTNREAGGSMDTVCQDCLKQANESIVELKE